MAAKKEPYIVTDAGGLRPDVAGKVRMVGEEVMLTPDEARWEVKRGIVITPEEAERRAEAAKAAASAKSGS